MNTEIAASFRKPKSVQLTRDELKRLRKFRKSFPTEVAAAAEIGIDRLVLNRIMTVGSGSPESVEKIKAKIDADSTSIPNESKID